MIKNSKKVRIITQNQNLEDELIKSLGLRNAKSLYTHFNATNKTTYKQTLANMIPEKLDIKLHELDFHTFWSDKVLYHFYIETEITDQNCELREIK